MIEMEQQTALPIATEKNDLKCADLLLEKGANAKILNSRNLTALHLAAIKGQRNMVKMMLDKYVQRLEVDRYKDYNGQTTREVIEQKFPEMEKELSEKLPFKNENWEVNAQDLKYYLNDGDETNFMKCMKDFQGEIPSRMAENLLTMSAQHNFRQAEMAILKKFGGKHINVREAAHAAIQNGHHVILGELLKVEPEMANDLILSVCAELGAPGKQGVDYKSNLLKCLELILEQKNVDVRCTDKEGNTPLHYAARANNRKAMSLLLKRGSYIGHGWLHTNTFNVPPIIHIPECTLSDYFDDCLKMTENQTNEDIIEFDYRCLMPHNIPAKQDTTHRPTRETEVLLYIARNENLNHLLKHPLLSSFLYLKWLMIRPVLYANFVFYGIFYFLLNIYILSMTYESPPNGNGKQTVSDSFDPVLNSTFLIRCYPGNFLRFFVTVLWLLSVIREIFLFAYCPRRYMIDWKNWLHVVLITFIFILFCGAGLWCRVVVIILSALVMLNLIRQHPKISASFEIFRMVFFNYVRLLFPYTFLIVAFALAFHILFKNNMNVSDPGHSFFKTIIMITSEFNSNDIPFVSHPVWSHIAFVLFSFFIAIVLFNLLNGLAISDTNEILSKAELIGLISRLRLIAYLEDIACNEPFSRFRNSHFLRWNPFGFFTNRILLFPHLENGKITVMCDNRDVYSNSVNRDEHWPTLQMDPVIIKQAKRIISDKNQLSDNENIMIVLNKQQEELMAVENALKNLCCALKNLISDN